MCETTIKDGRKAFKYIHCPDVQKRIITFTNDSIKINNRLNFFHCTEALSSKLSSKRLRLIKNQQHLDDFVCGKLAKQTGLKITNWFCQCWLNSFLCFSLTHSLSPEHANTHNILLIYVFVSLSLHLRHSLFLSFFSFSVFYTILVFLSLTRVGGCLCVCVCVCVCACVCVCVRVCGCIWPKWWWWRAGQMTVGTEQTRDRKHLRKSSANICPIMTQSSSFLDFFSVKQNLRFFAKEKINSGRLIDDFSASSQHWLCCKMLASETWMKKEVLTLLKALQPVSALTPLTGLGLADIQFFLVTKRVKLSQGADTSFYLL